MRVKNCFAALVTVLSASLIGCGGGGDSSTPAAPPPPAVAAPAAPAVTLNYGIKQLQFSWAAVSGATHYRLFERPDASAMFAQVGADLTSTTVNHDIALHRRVNAAYRIEACNSGGCTASTDVSLVANLVPAIGYLKASNTGNSDFFGTAIALSVDSNTLAVSAPGEDSSANQINGDQANNNASGAGAVYVFTRSAGSWVQQAYLKASNATASDGFGETLTISADGSILAVGAGAEDSAAVGVNGDQFNDAALTSGAVYVFARLAGAWSQQAYIKASNTEANDRFGSAVAVSGDGLTLAVGARQEDSNSLGINGIQTNNLAANAGAVYVFIRSVDVWTQQAYVKASNTQASDLFGQAVALSSDGSTLVVGATGEDSGAAGINGDHFDNSASASGAAFVFVRSAGVWTQQAYIKASNPNADDNFGVDVSMSADGNTLAVGADYESSSAAGINGNELDNSKFATGAVYVFTRNAGTWTQQAYVKASNPGVEHYFGFRVALSADGNTLAVTSVLENSNATGVNGDQSNNNPGGGGGAAYVFRRDNGVWSQLAYVKASNTEAYDDFGLDIALSVDGNTLAVGASREDSVATGVGGDRLDNSASSAGAVYLY